jgi:hypothetical protein
VDPGDDAEPAGGCSSSVNARCDQENLIGQLKNGVNAPRVPAHDLVSNWACM